MNRLLTWLPRGNRLDAATWRARHRVLLAVLLAHVPLLTALVLVTHRGAAVLGLDVGPVLVFAGLGASLRSRRARAVAVSLGLLYCAGDLTSLVHNTAMHFHFFVVLSLVAFYQDWVPFLLSIAFTLIHHIGFGLVDPKDVYGDPQSIAHPVTWALVHAAFVAAASVAQICYWRVCELAQEDIARAQQEAAARTAAELSHRLAVADAERAAAEAAAAANATRARLQDRLACDVAELRSASRDVDANVQSAANATEEMAASIRDIAGRVSEVAGVALDAQQRVGSGRALMETFAERSGDVGRVTEVITGIAEQTHLLALSAAIEAARAGSAGRGFSVVAQEVKDLAAATAREAAEIKRSVEAMKTGTCDVAGALAAIDEAVARLHDIQTGVAVAMEQQSVATSNIARNVAEAADGSSRIAAGLTDLAAIGSTPREGGHS